LLQTCFQPSGKEICSYKSSNAGFCLLLQTSNSFPLFSQSLAVKMLLQSLALAAWAIPIAVACDDCYGPTNFVKHERLVRRMQPTASNASYGPSNPLQWGQINFLQTTDTHGWLEGHIKEQNYGADWGDFVSFTRHMKRKAQKLNVDLLLIDTGAY
jgi:2',3'-cyclic-nucleotide 2'-phosphodiesterase (5'-nucleotidase family)